MIVESVKDARARSLELIADLSDEQLRVEKIDIVNPLDWEIGHVAYFQESFVLRQALGRAALREDADALFDSIAIEHDVRWDLPLPPRSELLEYVRRVGEITARLAEGDHDEDTLYRLWLSVFHEDMHCEALTYTRQTMGFSAPTLGVPSSRDDASAGPHPGDVAIAGGRFRLGAPRDGRRYHLDNEQWAHEREVEPFEIAKAPVTQSELAAFVDDGGYREREYWSDEGWRWRERVAATQPLYWRRHDGGWQRRHFDGWVALEPHQPMIHCGWYEAQAYCAWAGRRLPTELEWEVAAAAVPNPDGTLSGAKRHYPWGDDEPTPERVNMDWRGRGCVDVAAKPTGDSAYGCRQMLGNVWEWCSDTFGPYPGFEPGPYAEYSQPLFGSTKVLRGGGWATRSRLIRNTWRNYYEPHRRDVWSGFRTCAR